MAIRFVKVSAMKLKLRKIGNSYGVIFPKDEIEEFLDSMEIEVEIVYPERIIINEKRYVEAD